MTDRLELYRQIAERERLSRLEAERLLEVKSRELFEKNTTLEACVADFREVNALLSDVMAAAPDGIVTVRADFTIHGCNTALGRQVGKRRRDIVGAHIDDILPGFSPWLAYLPNGVFGEERRVARRASGGELPVEVRGHVGLIGKDIKYVLFVHDITARVAAEAKRKEIEQQADEGRRLEAIGALSAGIAHEINTPIQFIGDNIEFLKDALAQIFQSYKRYDALRAAVAGDARHGAVLAAVEQYNASVGLETLIAEIGVALDESREGITQVRDIILLMKDFAHPGSGKKDLTSLNDIVTNVVAICRHRHKGVAEVACELDGAVPAVKCRKAQIQQVLLNIVLNAIDAIDEHGVANGRVVIATGCDDEFVRVMISDNGCGVPQSLKEKIFDPFFTTKPVGKGTGQGLALAKDYVVKGHRGRLSLIDRPGFATTFLIELPRIEEVDLSSEEFLDDVA